MKPLTRRSVTTGLAAAVTAIPAVGLCRGATDASELRALIEAHRVAWAAFMVKVEADGLSKAGDPVPDGYHETFETQEELFLQICSHRCTTRDERRIKGEYLLSCSTVTDFWANDTAPGAMELLRSMVGEVRG